MRTQIRHGFLLLICLFAYLHILAPARAQVTIPVGSAETEIRAQVGEFYLNLSGYQSPYASIVLTSYDGATVLRSTVADATGNFSFTDVLIRRGMTGFCLVATDFRNLGSSTTCFSTPAATDNITMTDIFLPPTLGFSRTDIAVGTSALAFGYTMPGATVTLHISGVGVLTGVADQTGYYEITIANLPVGNYDIYATAQYQGIESVAPSRTQQIHVLSFQQQAGGAIGKLLRDLWNLLTSIVLNPWLWIILLLLLITYLVYKRWPEKFAFARRYLGKEKHESRLHHWWFIGY